MKMKVVCVETNTAGGYGCSKRYGANFRAVTDNNEENKKFFAATPAGDLHLQTLVEQPFEAGKEYYVELTPA